MPILDLGGIVPNLFTKRAKATEVDGSRRRALKVALSATAMATAPVSMASALTKQARRDLALTNMHTGESLEITYFDNGLYVDGALDRINDLMRDHRAEERYPISVKLLDVLHELRAVVRTQEPFRLLSGYRSPETNARLRKHMSGVAKRSYHMMGAAADVHLPDIDLKALHAQAIRLQAGGVGYYPRSGFVHLDVGPVRAWRG